MSIERTYTFFGAGPNPASAEELQDGQIVNLPSVGYVRTVTQVIIRAQVAPQSSALAVQLMLAGALQAPSYGLPQNVAYQENATAGSGVVIGSGVMPGIQLTTSAGAKNLLVMLVSTATPSNTAEATWVTFAESDVQLGIDVPTYTQMTAAAIIGSTDPVPDIVNGVTKEIYRAILGGSKVKLGPPGMIPPSLKRYAISMARYILFSNVSVLQRFMDNARKPFEDAMKTLDRIRNGELVEKPDVPLEDTTSPLVAWNSDPPIDM